MGFFEKYPNTDFHELNLDWLLNKMRELQIQFDEFKVVNNITFSGQWDITKQYPTWTIVSDNNIGYVSQKPVPAGIPLNNGNYWVEVIDYTAQIAGLETRVIDLENTVGDSSSGLVKDVNDLQAYIDMLSDHKVFWVGADCEYTTINAAITAARNVCTTTNRALIIVKPGTYNEHITLFPNPGIDIIGYNAKVVNNADYPDSPLYTTGEGLFVGLTFEYTGTQDNYGVHIEHDATNTTGTVHLINCEAISNSHFGLGCGLTPDSYVILENCICRSKAASNKVGLFIHNYANTANRQYFIARNCCFYGSDNTNDIIIQDATKYPSEQNKVSQLMIEFTDCVGHAESMVKFRCKPTGDPLADVGYIPDPVNGNILLSNKSNHNDFIALNVATFLDMLYETDAVIWNNKAYIPAPAGMRCNKYEITNINCFVGTDPYVTLTSISSGAFTWYAGTISKPNGTVCLIQAKVKPKCT